jgi:hypothetical protein
MLANGDETEIYTGKGSGVIAWSFLEVKYF